MRKLETVGNAIVSKPRRAGPWTGVRRLLIACGVAAATTGCYPRYDWRDYRPDCARGWCGFVATFPGKPTSATRDIPVAATRLPLTVHIVSIGDTSFAVLAFALRPGADATAARAVLEKKLLDDVGATSGRREATTVRAADRSAIAADAFSAEGRQGGHALGATARFVERDGRLVEILVLGPTDELAKDSGRQAIETFVTSLRLD